MTKTFESQQDPTRGTLQRRETAQSAGGLPAQDMSALLLHLQRTAGNRAVNGLLQRWAATVPAQVRRQADTPEVGPAGGPISEGLTDRIKARRGAGRALDGGVQERMEEAFGTPFDDVRVHADDEAQALNRSVQARAFTVGSDVFLGSDAAPSDTKLLAHELTHVVQQRGAPAGEPLTVGAAGDSHEQEADAVGAALTGSAVTGEPAPVGVAAQQVGRVIQRVPQPVSEYPTNLTSPGAPTKVAFSPLVIIKEDANKDHPLADLGTVGPNFQGTATLDAATKNVEVMTFIHGVAFPSGSDFSTQANTKFTVRADGSIKDITDTVDPVSVPKLTGATVTAIPRALTNTPHRMVSTVGLIFDGSTTGSTTTGTAGSSTASVGSSTTHTTGSANTSGSTTTGEISGSGSLPELPIGISAKGQYSHKDEDTTSESDSTTLSNGAQTTTGTSTSDTTSGPGTQIHIPATVTIDIESPAHEAHGAHTDIIDFGIGHAELKPGMGGAAHTFLLRGGPHGNENLMRLVQTGRAKILIEGYASCTGSQEANIDLARQRAKAMQSYMVEHLGIPAAAFDPVITNGQALSDEHTDDPKQREDPAWRKVTIEVIITES